MNSSSGRWGLGRSIAKRDRVSLRGSSRLFELSPVSAWDEDFSRVKKRLDDLKNEGVKDIRKYLRSHPAEVISLARKVGIVDVNDATIRLFEARNKTELRRGLHLIFDKESYDVFREELVALAEGKSEFGSEAVTRTLKGNLRHVLLTLSVPRGCLGSLAHVFVFVVDITGLKESEKELRESEEKYRTIVGSFPEPILLADAETGLVLEANRRAEEFLGISSDQIAGMPFRQLFLPEKNEGRRKIFEDDPESEASLPENPVICRMTGERVPVSIRSSRMAIQERRIVLIALREKNREPERMAEPSDRTSELPKMQAWHEERDKLSRREKDVITLVASGLTNRQIAAKLFLSIKTVETHRARIMDKLGFHKAADLVRFAIYAGLLGEAPIDR